MPDIAAAAITALAALVGAFLGSIGRPIAEDRVARWREAREGKAERAARARARIEKVAELLGDASAATLSAPWQRAHANLPTATAAVADAQLTESVDQFMRTGERNHLNGAKVRTGELLREADQDAR